VKKWNRITLLQSAPIIISILLMIETSKVIEVMRKPTTQYCFSWKVVIGVNAKYFAA